MFIRTAFLFASIMAFTAVSTQYAEAQHYIYQTHIGASDLLGRSLGGGQTLLQGPVNDELSEWVDLPFEWPFYDGSADGFYVSDNGYITFDRSAAESVAQQGAVTSKSGPNNAIYACWGDWMLGERGSVSSGTIGTAPNRTQVVRWIGLIPNNWEGRGRNTTNMFLYIHEQGGFEVLVNVSQGTDSFPATMGAENAAGTRATMVQGSPEFILPQLPALSSGEFDDVTWRFEYSETPQSARFTSSGLGAAATAGTPKKITAQLWNTGSEPIRSFTAHYKMDGGEERQKTVRGVDIPSSGTFEVAFDQAWNPQNPGTFARAEFWVSNINSAGTDSRGERFTDSIFVNLGKSAERKVLLEEFTGNWCAWCPDGMVRVKRIMKMHENVIGVAIHVRDSMETAEGAALADLHAPAFPEAMIDRRLWPEEASVAVNRVDDRWMMRTRQALKIPSPVQLIIEPEFDAETRQLSARVTAAFADYAVPGDLRLNFYLVEDHVTGQGGGWDQANAYSGSEAYKGHPFYDQPGRIENFRHEHVLRAVLSGTWGTKGVIAEAPKPGDRFSRTYSMELPPDFKPEDLQLVAFVSYYGPDPGDRYVLNAGEVLLKEYVE